MIFWAIQEQYQTTFFEFGVKKVLYCLCPLNLLIHVEDKFRSFGSQNLEFWHSKGLKVIAENKSDIEKWLESSKSSELKSCKQF